MSPLVLGLVLAAAFAHAGWNLLAKTAGGGAAFVWLTALVSAVVYAPVALGALLADPGRLDLEVLAFVVGSGVLHGVYSVLLQRGYRVADLSLVYPLARGTGPLLATVAAIALLGERPGAVALAGAAVIVVAVLSLGARPAALRERAAMQGAAFALMTGVVIAGYTLWDKHAVGTLDASPILYLWGAIVCEVILLAPVVARRSGWAKRVWGDARRQVVGVAVLGPAAYVLVLFALAVAPVSLVAPARESSILIGTALGAGVLAEGDARRRLVSAAAIVLGVLLLAAG